MLFAGLRPLSGDIIIINVTICLFRCAWQREVPVDEDVDEDADEEEADKEEAQV
jgi:hypothetical protein